MAEETRTASTAAEEALGGGERVAEMATVAVGADFAVEHHAADLGLVPRVADDGAELGDAVSELALVAVGARPRLFPLVAQLCLEHALVVHVQLPRRVLLGLLLLAFLAAVRSQSRVRALLPIHNVKCQFERRLC